MAFDFTPLFRSTIGFDGMTALFTHALEREGSGFPPYNIEKSVLTAWWSAVTLNRKKENEFICIAG